MKNYRDVEREIKKVGSDPTEVCRRAGIARSTLMRWKQGNYIGRASTVQAVERAIAAIARDKLRQALKAVEGIQG